MRLEAAGDLTAIAPQAEPGTAKAYEMLRWMIEQGCSSSSSTRLALEQGFLRDYERGPNILSSPRTSCTMSWAAPRASGASCARATSRWRKPS